MGAQNGVIQVERRALRIQGTGATVAGTANTNIIAFTAAATAWQSTILGVPGTTTYPIGATFVAPVENSGTWINVSPVGAATVAGGSLFKFCRKGVYKATLAADGTLSDLAGAQLAITLDQAVAQDTVAAGSVSALSDIVLDFNNSNGVVDAAIPSRCETLIYVTDRLAGGAQPSADGVTRGVGVLRFLANNGANAVVATAFVVASIRASIIMENEISGT